jgi:protein SDA1
MIGDRRL